MAEAMSEERASSWYDDAPITDEQIESVRQSLLMPIAERGAAFAPFVVRKMLAEIDRLKAQRTELRDENDRLRAQLAEIGETREEYGALYLSWANSSHGEIRHVGPFKTANEVHEASQSTEWPLLSRDAWNLGRRLAGEWREVSE